MSSYTISTYAQLREEISREAGGSSDSNFDSAIERAIYLAETQMNYGVLGMQIPALRIPEMMVRSRETVNERWESLPPGFLEMRASWWIQDFDEANPEAGRDVPLASTSPEVIAHYSRYHGNPKRICVVGGQYRIEPRVTPDTVYHVRLWYFKALPPISESDTTQLITTILERYPGLYLYGALANLGSYAHGDPRLAEWKAMFAGLITAANNSAGRTGRMRSYAAA